MLPHHHPHGMVNSLNCALWNGATCEILPGKFKVELTWETLLRREDPINIFMGVPTVYKSLAKHLQDNKLDGFKSKSEIKEILI